MLEALQYSEGDIDRFDKRRAFLADSNPLKLLSRGLGGDKILPAKISVDGQGRYYNKNLYYVSYEEDKFVGRRRFSCNMTVYYNPDTRRIDSVLCAGDCADDPKPDVPGVKFLQKTVANQQ